MDNKYDYVTRPVRIGDGLWLGIPVDSNHVHLLREDGHVEARLRALECLRLSSHLVGYVDGKMDGLRGPDDRGTVQVNLDAIRE